DPRTWRRRRAGVSKIPPSVPRGLRLRLPGSHARNGGPPGPSGSASAIPLVPDVGRRVALVSFPDIFPNPKLHHRRVTPPRRGLPDFPVDHEIPEVAQVTGPIGQIGQAGGDPFPPGGSVLVGKPPDPHVELP